MKIQREGASWPVGWNLVRQGGGGLVAEKELIRFVRPGNDGLVYANAQMDDHSGLTRGRFAWKPPLHLTVRARFSHEASALKGTAGFGFWNDPFGMSGTWPPALPQAAWFFFASPPSDMPLAAGVPGCGWKAAVIDAGRWSACALVPLAPLLIPLLRWPRAYRSVWPALQRTIGVEERILVARMTGWHTYCLSWLSDGVRFEVDGELLLECARAPRGPLGLVAWIDNQYLVATPQGRLRHGYVLCDHPQWLEIAELTVDRAPAP